jgi:DNA-binding HxlR family transcriptional regulator
MKLLSGDARKAAAAPISAGSAMRCSGVIAAVLIQQLKDLEADCVLARTDYKEVPPRVDYALTPLGRSLAEAIVPLCTWGTENARELASIFAKRDASPPQMAESP